MSPCAVLSPWQRRAQKRLKGKINLQAGKGREGAVCPAPAGVGKPTGPCRAPRSCHIHSPHPLSRTKPGASTESKQGLAATCTTPCRAGGAPAPKPTPRSASAPLTTARHPAATAPPAARTTLAKASGHAATAPWQSTVPLPVAAERRRSPGWPRQDGSHRRAQRGGRHRRVSLTCTQRGAAGSGRLHSFTQPGRSSRQQKGGGSRTLQCSALLLSCLRSAPSSAPGRGELLPLPGWVPPPRRAIRPLPGPKAAWFSPLAALRQTKASHLPPEPSCCTTHALQPQKTQRGCTSPAVSPCRRWVSPQTATCRAPRPQKGFFLGTRHLAGAEAEGTACREAQPGSAELVLVPQGPGSHAASRQAAGLCHLRVSAGTKGISGASPEQGRTGQEGTGKNPLF